jgi:dTDP-4-amino-4,6-dideoxygalactose transaminase
MIFYVTSSNLPSSAQLAIAHFLRAPGAFLTASGTTGVLIADRLLDIDPDDAVSLNYYCEKFP